MQGGCYAIKQKIAKSESKSKPTKSGILENSEDEKESEKLDWVYCLEAGIIKELFNMTHEDYLDPLYELVDL